MHFERQARAYEVTVASLKYILHLCAIISVDTGPNPLPTLNAPAISYQWLLGFWGGAQAHVSQMRGPEVLAGTSAGGRHLHIH
jgi:hypothetical protein